MSTGAISEKTAGASVAGREKRSETSLVVAADFEGRYHFARLVDVSERGFQVQLFISVPAGERIPFQMESHGKVFRCLGQVMWCRRKAWFPRGVFAAGIRIVGNKFPKEFLAAVD